MSLDPKFAASQSYQDTRHRSLLPETVNRVESRVSHRKHSTGFPSTRNVPAQHFGGNSGWFLVTGRKVSRQESARWQATGTFFSEMLLERHEHKACVIAAARDIPGVCGVFGSKSLARTVLMPCSFQSICIVLPPGRDGGPCNHDRGSIAGTVGGI
jgi:hypothetical protein